MGGPPAPPRVSVTLPVYLDHPTTVWGTCTELSVTGLLVATAERPEPGSCHRLGLTWRTETYWCSAQVVRHTEDAVALRFQTSDAIFSAVLEEVVAASPPATRQWEGYEQLYYWG